MSEYKSALPEYPLTRDMWDILKEESRPIVIYGMGNGADKLIARLGSYGVTVADIFASDGFVRGHEFHGIRVKSFAEIKEKYSDFVILLSFATRLGDVMSLIAEMDREYELYIPDMPVAGEDEYFDRAFFNSHYAELCEARQRLCDQESKRVFDSVVNYKLTGKLSYLLEATVDKDALYCELPCESIKSYIDAGAYNGDTLREAIEYFPNLGYATLIEPDPKTFKRLNKYLGGVSLPVNALNMAVWNCVGEASFQGSGNRNSSVSSTASFEHKDTAVRTLSVDSLDISPDYIKYDVEGAEREALVGSSETIGRCHPTLLVSLYHRSRDIFSIVNYLGREYPFYKMKLRRLSCIPAWELNLILNDSSV